MRGLKLHDNLEGAEFLGEFRTKPNYRLYSINDIHPGMYEVEEGGVAVTGELYRMSNEIWQCVEAGEPPHLYAGDVYLENGNVVEGILYPKDEAVKYKDISEFGDWRSYMSSVNK